MSSCHQAKPWQCKCCGLCNSYFRPECQACFNGYIVPCSNICQCVVMNPCIRNLLVHGYLRQNLYKIDVPTELSNLCLSFYNDTMNWKLYGNALSDLFENTRQRVILGPRFKISGVSFQLWIMLKEYKQKYHIVFGFKTNKGSLRQNCIKTMTINYILSLNEMDYTYKHTKIIRRHHQMGSQFQATWYWLQMKLESIKSRNCKQLNFECHAEILDIEYHTKICFEPKAHQIFKKYKFFWDLDEKQMQIFHSCQYDESIYSENFNYDSFCIVLSPKGLSTVRLTSDRGSEGFVLIKIKTLRLPSGIK